MRIKVFFISAIVALGAFTSCRESAVEMEDPAVEVVSELRRVNRLSLAEMSINKVGTISDSGATGFASLLNMLKVGDRIGVYSYHTYLEAYMDLDALDAADLEVYQDRRLVKLRLPAIQVRLSGRDATVTEEHYRVTGISGRTRPTEGIDEHHIETGAQIYRRIWRAASCECP